jgi:hypothetical protein
VVPQGLLCYHSNGQQQTCRRSVAVSKLSKIVFEDKIVKVGIAKIGGGRFRMRAARLEFAGKLSTLTNILPDSLETNLMLLTICQSEKEGTYKAELKPCRSRAIEQRE